MTVATFRAHCAKGHDRIDFQGEDGAKAFEAHMKAAHGRHKWSQKTLYNGKPYPWQAPKAPADTSKLTAVLLKWDDGRGDSSSVLEWWTPEKITPDDLQPGDVFALKGCEYAVQSVEGDSYTLTMTKGPRAGTPRDTAPVARSSFDRLGGEVVLLRRAS